MKVDNFNLKANIKFRILSVSNRCNPVIASGKQICKGAFDISMIFHANDVTRDIVESLNNNLRIFFRKQK
jgi:hypothetical protein